MNRTPAVKAWQERLAREGHALVSVDPALMPPQYPNLEQSKLLLAEGVRDPVVRRLTIVSIVEGFGAIIRDVAVPDLASQFVEPIDGTALAHLGKPTEEVIFSFFAGIVFGLADVETRSILPSFAAHFFGSALFDTLALAY